MKAVFLILAGVALSGCSRDPAPLLTVNELAASCYDRIGQEVRVSGFLWFTAEDEAMTDSVGVGSDSVLGVSVDPIIMKDSPPSVGRERLKALYDGKRIVAEGHVVHGDRYGNGGLSVVYLEIQKIEGANQPVEPTPTALRASGAAHF